MPLPEPFKRILNRKLDRYPSGRHVCPVCEGRMWVNPSNQVYKRICSNCMRLALQTGRREEFKDLFNWIEEAREKNNKRNKRYSKNKTHYHRYLLPELYDE
jgi:hypothetical protein